MTKINQKNMNNTRIWQEIVQSWHKKTWKRQKYVFLLTLFLCLEYSNSLLIISYFHIIVANYVISTNFRKYYPCFLTKRVIIKAQSKDVHKNNTSLVLNLIFLWINAASKTFWTIFAIVTVKYKLRLR